MTKIPSSLTCIGLEGSFDFRQGHVFTSTCIYNVLFSQVQMNFNMYRKKFCDMYFFTIGTQQIDIYVPIAFKEYLHIFGLFLYASFENTLLHL